MLSSFTQPFTTFPSQIPWRASKHQLCNVLVIRSSGENGNNNVDVSGTNTSVPPVQQPIITPSDTVEIRFKRGSRRRKKQEDQDGNSMASLKPKLPPKKWDDMNLNEKAIELYVGEKGLLFWLNKFAYASIFIIIGGWILFRFAGPALNLYQLDTPPLAPTSLLKG